MLSYFKLCSCIISFIYQWFTNQNFNRARTSRSEPFGFFYTPKFEPHLKGTKQWRFIDGISSMSTSHRNMRGRTRYINMVSNSSISLLHSTIICCGFYFIQKKLAWSCCNLSNSCHMHLLKELKRGQIPEEKVATYLNRIVCCRWTYTNWTTVVSDCA